ncbi:ChiQ/YbfN family lipoprotein [Shimwellia blattae]|uniref:Putative lipoprotein YbfN n=1 Tax=Shimwellia blattae (strain ATCC 29907 / DSM 4481 / JCM 1650 / NBRC 105725 / CDC 9005-74) TaxID=630626 RepID=I2BB68_SHIBC|nr:ChiQ/YbfN family lipoprotein [Shimwellia blattae]AFJ47772.1 putative lipoprotein YbfN [Shimwellia blattae DSM 4481 = NBRC 105725]GAB79652.1 hypothetical protein YbfN [Shimwellia blattae DSM 4481 = NBRC 105725]VDY65272.1 Uncharacterised protein [Shimwellia blattae]VEC24086.1 Uncharacterised protein [Shimwellia blattae]
MKKQLFVALVALAIAGCSATADAPRQESRLKEAYSACIRSAQGNPDKVDACQTVLSELRKEKQHQAFAEQQQVKVLDYQHCINARKMGNDEEASVICTRIWQELHASNQSQ